MASKPIHIDNHMLTSAKLASNAGHRSLSKQIEYWAMIGRIAEENPDLNFDSIKVLLQSEADLIRGNVELYEFRKQRMGG